jgi:hypothetical protein
VASTAGTSEQLFRFSRDSRAGGAAREVVRAVLCDVRREVASDILLCVTELVTTSVTWSENGADNPIELRLLREDELLADRWGVERDERRRIWFEKDL